MICNTDNLDAIFFDFDGVLADSLKIKGDAFLSLFNDCNEQEKKAIEQHFYRYTGHSRQEKLQYIYQNILLQALSSEKLEQLCKQFKERSLKAVIDSQEIGGTSALLNSLPDNMIYFVVSGTPEKELQQIVMARGIDKYFTQVKGTPTRKERNIAELLKHYQLDPKRCLMIGDGLVDKDAADYNQMPFIGVVETNKTSPFPAETQIFTDLNAIAYQLGLVLESASSS